MSTIPQSTFDFEVPPNETHTDRRFKSDEEYHLELAARWRLVREQITAERQAERAKYGLFPEFDRPHAPIATNAKKGSKRELLDASRNGGVR